MYLLHTLIIIFSYWVCISSAVFYYLLANLSPQYRSSLQNIQLVTLARTQDVTCYGIDKILEPFMKDIKQLEKVSYNDTITVEPHMLDFPK